jgi:catechol 2,3-dioxygenase-like lactoylglutathione lyase family enzyme
MSGMTLISRRWFLALGAMAMVAQRSFGAAEENIPNVPSDLDHIILGTSDLDRGISWMEERCGVRAVFGGVHPGRGTRNALLSLGPRRYLEIMAPDPQQAEAASATSSPLFKKLLGLKEPKLIAWAVHTNDLASLAKKAAAAVIDIEPPRDGSRARPDGKTLRWKSFSLKDDRDGLLPFFIEWSADSVHPSQDAPAGCLIKAFSLESWIDDVIQTTLRKLGIAVESKAGSKPLVRARIAGKKGEVELS